MGAIGKKIEVLAIRLGIRVVVGLVGLVVVGLVGHIKSFQVWTLGWPIEWPIEWPVGWPVGWPVVWLATQGGDPTSNIVNKALNLLKKVNKNRTKC